VALRCIYSGGKVTVRTLTLGSRHLASRISDMTSLDQNNVYVTLLSTASRDIYDLNTHADFTVKLAQSIDLGSTSKWEVGVCEISCSSSPEGANPVLLYCNLISPHLLGDSTVRWIWTFRLYPNAMCQHEFQNVQYEPVEQRVFQDYRMEFLTTEGLHIPFEDSTMPTKVVLHFRKNYQR